MKTNFKLQLSSVLVLTFVHNVLFWNQSFGLNTLAFISIFTLVLLFLKFEKFKHIHVIISLAGVFFSAGMVVLHGSSIAKFAYITSFTVFIGFFNAELLRNFFYPFWAVIEKFSVLPSNYQQEFSEFFQNENANSIKRKLKLSLIPLIGVSVFYVLFKFANPVFDKITTQFWNGVFTQFQFLFQDFSITRLMFTLFGFVVSSLLIINSTPLKVLFFENNQNDNLERVRENRKKIISKHPIFKTLALKNEYQSGILMLCLINALLFFVNAIDINWIWFNFDPLSVPNLSQFVHEGTYLLIASILLSMGIMEFLFRKNLNFYAKNEWLKRLCYLWILQNVVLVISVGLRNYHYIVKHGLAYKRIGVVFFLILTLYGLCTQLIKIKMTKSSYFLMRVNSWSFYGVMLVLSVFNWDIIITNHNLKYPKVKNIDFGFLLEMSPKTLPVLMDYTKTHQLDTYKEEILETKKMLFMTEYPTRTWFSWNYADEKAYELLNSK